MDPVSLIVAALAAGAVAGAQNTATEVVKDAYAALKGLVAGRLHGRRAGEVALAQHESQPAQWRAALEAELAAADAGQGMTVVRAARRGVGTGRPVRVTGGDYLVDVRGAHAVQIGNSNIQTNTFGPPITPERPRGRHGGRPSSGPCTVGLRRAWIR